MPYTHNTIPQRFYHGTRADLNSGDLVEVGYNSNFGTGKPLSWVYLTGTLDAAIWGASWPLAKDGKESISLNRPAQSWTTPT